MLDVLKVKKVLAQFFFGDQVRRPVIMCGELADGTNVRLLSPLRETSELETLDHSLSQFGHGYTSSEKLNSQTSGQESRWLFY
jgi:hypothetical protein